jgi:hypothetical protein
MKTTVITDKKGNVLATYRHPAQTPEGTPIFSLHGGTNDTVHELDLPSEFESIASADELHKRVKQYLKKAPPKRR